MHNEPSVTNVRSIFQGRIVFTYSALKDAEGVGCWTRYEAVRLDEKIIPAGQQGADDAVAAIKIVRRDVEESNAAVQEMQEKYGR